MLQLLNTPIVPLYWFKLTDIDEKETFLKYFFKHLREIEFMAKNVTCENKLKIKTRINIQT